MTECLGTVSRHIHEETRKGLLIKHVIRNERQYKNHHRTIKKNTVGISTEPRNT